MNREALELITSLQEENQKLEQRVERLQSEGNEKDQRIGLLKEQIDDLLRRIYGRRSERFENPDQLRFDDLLKELEEKRDALREYEKVEYARKKPMRRGPKPLPDHLPRDQVRIDPEESERVCACCSEAMERVDETVTEELTVKPPEFRVTEYVRGKWRCKACMTGEVSKPLPPRPIEQGRPSPTLLAYIIVSKWADHLPLYRQEQIFRRYGIGLRRSTMDSWLGQLVSLLRPIVESMKRSLLSRSFLQSDDTVIQALDPEVKGKSRRCYLWAHGAPRGEVVYQFTKGRSSRGPLEFFESFRGDLQTDGFAGYNDLYRTGRVRHIGCMAHIRRKFFEAKAAAPERVGRVLELIGALYAIETRAREENLEVSDRPELREKESVPLLDDLEREIDALSPAATPKSKLGRAVEYAKGQWPAMLRYVEAPESELDNNWCENALRPVVLGRKNFLFLGSVEGGGARAEVFFSLVQSCRRLEVDPFGYLSDVIERVSTHPHSRLEELTPRGWRETHEAAENSLEQAAR